MGRLTDQGLGAITEHCTNLEHLMLSLLSDITGVTLIPLFQDSSRALKFKTLRMACRRVRIFICEHCHSSLVDSILALQVRGCRFDAWPVHVCHVGDCYSS